VLLKLSPAELSSSGLAVWLKATLVIAIAKSDNPSLFISIKYKVSFSYFYFTKQINMTISAMKEQKQFDVIALTPSG